LAGLFMYQSFVIFNMQYFNDELSNKKCYVN
jgi:hypothetical protein